MTKITSHKDKNNTFFSFYILFEAVKKQLKEIKLIVLIFLMTNSAMRQSIMRIYLKYNLKAQKTYAAYDMLIW